MAQPHYFPPHGPPDQQSQILAYHGPPPQGQYQGGTGHSNDPFGLTGQHQGATGYEGAPGPSYNQCYTGPGYTTQDLEEPHYLIGHEGTVKLTSDDMGHFGFTTNFLDEPKEEYTRHSPQTYSRRLGPGGMLLVSRDPNKNPYETEVPFWTRDELPTDARIRIVIASADKDKDKRKKPIQQTSNNGIQHYILPAKEGNVLYDCQYNHPVLVAPVGYFQKEREPHLETQADGYNYIGKFCFPCLTSDLKLKSKLKPERVLLVASLEVPTAESMHRLYRSVGVTTVKVRVCGSAGRDKTEWEKKLSKEGASLPSKGAETSDSEVCSSDGNGPPKSKRTKEMTTDTREAAGSSSSVTSTGPAALEGGVSSSGDIPATADPMHVIQQLQRMQQQERQAWCQMMAKQREEHKQMLAEEREEHKRMLAEEREEHKRILAAEREEHRRMLEEERGRSLQWLLEENGLGFPAGQLPTSLEFP